MRNFRTNVAQRRDHYQDLTDKIFAALEAGTAPWRRPWNADACGGSTMPVNATTGHRYRGVNVFVLGMSPLALASGDPRWRSYRQALAGSWQVRRAERATPVYFYKPIEIADKSDASEGETRRIPMLRSGAWRSPLPAPSKAVDPSDILLPYAGVDRVRQNDPNVFVGIVTNQGEWPLGKMQIVPALLPQSPVAV